MSKREIQIGQVYQTVGSAGGRAWRVASKINLMGIPHARVVSTEDEGRIKTLSCLVLADADFYKLVPPSAA